MVGTASMDIGDNLLRQQIEGAIDEELNKLEFTSLCKQIALKVVQRVQRIDNEHNEIKSFYENLGTQVEGYISDANGKLKETLATKTSTTKSVDVIVIDDDEEEEISSKSCESGREHSEANQLNGTSNKELSHDISTVNGNSSVSHEEVPVNNGVNIQTAVNNSSDVNVNGTIVPQESENEDFVSLKENRHADVEASIASSSTISSFGTDVVTNKPVKSSKSNSKLAKKGGIRKSSEKDSTSNAKDIDVTSNEQISNDKDESINSESDSACRSIKSSNTSNLDNQNKDDQISSNPPEEDSSPQARSPLIMKITALSEKAKCSEAASKYCSKMVSSDGDSGSKIGTEQTALDVSKQTHSRNIRRKPFVFKEGTIVYARPCGSDIWYDAELLREVFTSGKKQPKYQVRFMGGQRLRQKILLKSIATKDVGEPEQFELGTRVVAGRPSDTVNTTVSKKYKDISSGNNINVMFAGVVCELACEANRNRYLVFFDDGYAQYFSIANLFLVIRPSREVWNDVAEDCREFIKEYLQEYPYRPLVCTAINATMQTEWNGEWWKSRVVSIDASLVKMLFDVDKRSEWIYRGTTRLEPLFNHFNGTNPTKKKKKDKVGGLPTTYVDEKITHPQFGISKYSTKDSQGELQRETWDLSSNAFNSLKRLPTQSPEDVFNFAQSTEEEQNKILPKKLRVQTGHELPKTSMETGKSPTISSLEAFGVLGALQMNPNSTNSASASGNMQSQNNNLTSKSNEVEGTSDGKVRKSLKARNQALTSNIPPIVSISPKKKGPHPCDKSCIRETRKIINEHNIGVFNYLSVPFKLGWRRESSKKNSNWHRDIYYRTPCNKRLRNLAEVTKYLTITKCLNVSIDMFCFYPSISCRNQPLRPKPTYANIDDLSGGKETCPIVCVNEVNAELPNPIVYISHRMPAEDVFINTDPGFLSCCDCDDNCQDKSKCECAQLTIECTKAIEGTADLNAGYNYRRLKETVTTGIYECNQNCSCSHSTCYNRVVQNGIQLRLQVFMTESCGWGLRCINDIPKGTFICTYTGQVLNEQTANKEGMDFGDEYLAELDHIEVVEKAKEDYESDVPELKDNITISSDDSDSDSNSSVLSISSDSSSDSRLGNISKKGNVTEWRAIKEILCPSKSNGPKDNNESPGPADCKKVNSLEPIDTSSSEVKRCDSPANESGDTKPTYDNIKLPIYSQASDSNTTAQSLISNPFTAGKHLARKSTSSKVFATKNSGVKKRTKTNVSMSPSKETHSVLTRTLYDGDQQLYVIDAKCFGNVGRFLNHSCSPNLFVQNVMVDTHDLRFPWVAFFAQQNIPAYTELTWDYSYEIGSVAGKTLICNCGSKDCRGRLL